MLGLVIVRVVRVSNQKFVEITLLFCETFLGNLPTLINTVAFKAALRTPVALSLPARVFANCLLCGSWPVPSYFSFATAP